MHVTKRTMEWRLGDTTREDKDDLTFDAVDTGSYSGPLCRPILSSGAIKDVTNY